MATFSPITLFFLFCSFALTPFITIAKTTANATISNATAEYYISNSTSYNKQNITCSPSLPCTVVCNTDNGCMSATINASLATSLNVRCSKYAACTWTTIYCPDNTLSQCNIHCPLATTCYRINIYLPSKDHTNFHLQCHNDANWTEESWCDSAQFHCQDTGLTTTYSFIYASWSWICRTNDCCPVQIESNVGLNIIDCATNSSRSVCQADCNGDGGCPFKTIINGSQASSLDVNCDKIRGCQYIDIICPNDGICNLNCTKPRACEYITVRKARVSSINILCTGNQGCEGMVVNVNVSDDAIISCKYGQRPCSNAVFNIDGVDPLTNVSIVGAEYHGRIMNDVIVSVTGVHALHVTCSGFHSCQLLSVYGSRIHAMSVMCEGQTSCQDMVVWIDRVNTLSMQTNNASAFEDAMIGVEYIEPFQVLVCMENITLYSGLNVTPIIDSYCRHCLYHGPGFISNHYIVYNDTTYDWHECMPTQNPTIYPTLEPTISTRHPTRLTISSPSELVTSSLDIVSTSYNDPHSADSSDDVLVAVIICICVVFLCLLVLCFFKDGSSLRKKYIIEQSYAADIIVGNNDVRSEPGMVQHVVMQNIDSEDHVKHNEDVKQELKQGSEMAPAVKSGSVTDIGGEANKDKEKEDSDDDIYDVPSLKVVQEWNTHDLLKWMMAIDNGRYTKYKTILYPALIEEDVNGTNINHVNEQDLRHYGVIGLSDRMYLMQQIQTLFNQGEHQDTNVPQAPSTEGQ
eukprot:7211_1